MPSALSVLRHPAPLFASLALGLAGAVAAQVPTPDNAGFGAIYRLPAQDSWFSILAFVGLGIVAYAIVGWVRDAHRDAPH